MMSAQRMVFLVMAILVGLGIYLTGYKTANWVLYIPALALLSASITGICPGMILFKKMGFK